MSFEKELPEWKAKGIKPSKIQREEGWKEGVKPPAQWHNWWMNTSYEALKELQKKAETKAGTDDKVSRAIKESKKYTSDKFEDAKEYTNKAIGDFDLSALETKEDAQSKLKTAKSYTDQKVSGIEVPVKSVNGKEGEVELDKDDLGLSEVKNVEQASKEEFNDLKEKVGNTEELETENKESLVKSVNELEQKRAAHLAESVTNEEGAHNFRITDGKAEYYEGDKWNRLRVGTPFRVGNVIDPSVSQEPSRVLEISWKDPADLTMKDKNDETVILTHWAGTQLRRKKEAYPVDENDGELVIDNKERGKYFSTPFQDKDLEDGEEYFYMLFPYTEEGEFTVDSSNRIKEVAVTKLDRSAPSSLSVSNIEYDRATVTSDSGAVVSLDKTTWHNSPHTFTGLTEETKYTPYAKFEEDNTYFESPIKTGSSFETPSEAPGPGKLIAGDMQAGYFGRVPASELFTGSELASLVGISQGTLQHSDTDWLKFACKGKILFRPMKAIRYSISWNHINEANCVFGDKTVKKNGMTFKVRLMKGASTDPSKNNNSDRGAKGSEWNRLMLPIHERAKNKDWNYPDYVESDIPDWGVGFTDADLLTNSAHGDGSYVWCQETTESNSSFRVYRGYGGVSGSNWGTSSDSSSYRGWAPVLELSTL